MDGKIKNKEKMINQMTKKQISEINNGDKFLFKDIKRISKNLDFSIFGKRCSIWKGPIMNKDHVEKGRYINFFFNGKKRALHRLLYINYVGILSPNEYLKFICANKGTCCNINHFVKYKKKKNSEDQLDENDRSDGISIKNIANKMVINFD